MPNRSATADKKEIPRASRRNTELNLANPIHGEFIAEWLHIAAERLTRRYRAGAPFFTSWNSRISPVKGADDQ